jgi:hypothetical protein
MAGRSALRLDLPPLRAAGFGVGGAGAVIGFFDQSMRLGHNSFPPVLTHGLPVFWSPDHSAQAVQAEGNRGLPRRHSRLLEFHVHTLAKFL